MDLLAQAVPLNQWGVQPWSGEMWGKIIVAFVLCMGAIFALTKAPTRLRRPVVWTFTFASGLFYVLLWIWPQPVNRGDNDLPRDAVERFGFFLGDTLPRVADVANILTAILLGLGIYSLLRIHLGRIFKRQQDRFFSWVFLVAMVSITVVGYLDWTMREFGDKEGKLLEMTNWQFPNLAQNLLFDGLLMQMDSAMFSMIAFFILSAAYRAFRIRSVEATVLMASALILMISLLGGVVYGWNHTVANIAAGMHLPHADPSINEASYLNSFKISSMAGWVKSFLQVPALRAVDFGIGLGALAMGLRLWLGLEKGGVSV
ncbi:MAG: hypothetical protein JST30_12305 [Armatimonadetes bacterium]|nr:hypothetical protein [Armatimonadota bacterium]